MQSSPPRFTRGFVSVLRLVSPVHTLHSINRYQPRYACPWIFVFLFFFFCFIFCYYFFLNSNVSHQLTIALQSFCPIIACGPLCLNVWLNFCHFIFMLQPTVRPWSAVVFKRMCRSRFFPYNDTSSVSARSACVCVFLNIVDNWALVCWFGSVSATTRACVF